MLGNFKILLIGGSAGSLQVLGSILNALPKIFNLPIVIILHRQKNVNSKMSRLLGKYATEKTILEPDDKELISECCIYLAPQNYHLLIEEDHSFSLDYSEPVLFSRPSIDVSFESAARVFKQHAITILLSGANSDGTKGIETILKNGGTAIVQSPHSAEFNMMPQAALDKNPSAYSLNPANIVRFVLSLNS